MRNADPGIEFFLGYAEAEGALWEEDAGRALLLLPPGLQADLDLPEEIAVTADPEVAREDGALLLIPGHPVLDQAAAAVLERGDVGRSRLAWPTPSPPRPPELLARAREQFPVDHGRLDLAGPAPFQTYLPVVRLGVLVNYSVSLEDRFQEREEVWVDARTCLPCPEQILRCLRTSPLLPGDDPSRAMLPPDLPGTVAAAHRLVEQRASARKEELAGHSDAARREELARAAAYYEAALESIARRASGAPSERKALFEAQAESTLAERDRRLADIKEKFRASCDVRPFRLHMVGVPALSLLAQVRRGDRTHPLSLTWVLPAATFAPVRCPHCRAPEGLVAGRDRLGCRACLRRPAAAPVPPADRPPGPEPSRGGTVASPAAPPPERTSVRAPTPGAGAPASPDSLLPPVDVVLGGISPAGARAPWIGPVSPAPRGRQPRAGALRGSRLPDPERVTRAGNKLAREFWLAAIDGERWRRRATVPHSPLEALMRLYGAQGSLLAVGAPPGGEPSDISMATDLARPGLPFATTGFLFIGLVPYPYTLRWRLESGRAIAGEVLPYPAAFKETFPSPGTLNPGAASRLFGPLPDPRVELDPVASALWASCLPAWGLPFVVRCLALWWSAAGTLAGSRTGAAQAAAVAGLVGRRSYGRFTIEEAAFTLGAGADEAARAARALREVLGPPSAGFW